MEMARAHGERIGLLRPITLWPFPEKEIARLVKQGVKGILVVEINAGQMVYDVRLAARHTQIPVTQFGRLGGIVPDPDEILQALDNLKKEVHD